MNKIQKENLIGLLLGDGHLEKHRDGVKACLRIVRKQTDKEYLKYHQNIFIDFSPKLSDYEIFDKRTNKIYYGSRLRTPVRNDLTKIWKKWYVNGRKTIPDNLKLTKTILAVWFADDGSIELKKGRYSIKLATHGFLKKEVTFLKQLLKDTFDLDFKIYKENSGTYPQWFLRINNKKGVKKFTDIIDLVFPSGMERKSNIWRNSQSLLIKDPNPPCPFCKSNFVYKDGAKSKKKYKCQSCKRTFLTERTKKVRAQLNAKIVKQIRNLWCTKKYSKNDLCKKFNASLSTIDRIVNNKIWNDI